MAGGRDVGGRSPFAEHLLDGVTGDQVDQEEDQGHYQPDYREGVEDALEEGFQVRCWSLVCWSLVSGR